MNNFHKPYIKGYVDGTFKPDHSVTRAEIAAMLARNLNYQETQKVDSAPFPDIQGTHWAVGAIEFVKQQGLMIGDNKGNFNMNTPLTRAEMASIVARYKQLELPRAGEAQRAFTDITGHWGVKEIAATKNTGLMIGYEDAITFRPNDGLTRAEAVKVINRMFNRGPLYGVIQPPFPDVPVTHWAYHEIEEASIEHSFTLRTEGGENIN